MVAASSISVTASEPLAAVAGVTLDGGATGAPTISGATATFATGPLADGPHTLAGTLVDAAGKTARFTTHFTIVSGPPPANWPYVEMNAFQGLTTTLSLERRRRQCHDDRRGLRARPITSSCGSILHCRPSSTASRREHSCTTSPRTGR